MTDSVKIDTALGAKEQEILEKYDREWSPVNPAANLIKG